MARETIPATPLSAIKSKSQRKLLDNTCNEIREVQEQIAALEIRKKTLMEETVKPLIDELGFDKIQNGNEWMVLRTSQTRKTIIPERLVELGVPIKTIEKATDVKVIEIVSVRGVTEKAK